MIEWIISSSVLIILVLAVRALGKNRLSCRVRYALWLLVLIRLLVPMQLFSASWGATAVELPQSVTEPSIYVMPTGSTELPASVLTDDGPISEKLLDVWADDHSRMTDFDNATVTYTHYAVKWSVTDIFRIVWLTGAGLFATVLLISNLRFLRRIRRSRVLYDALCGGMRVYVAEGLSSPCLVGVLRPSVYLTPECTKDERTLRHVLAHETTHRLHGDCAWSVLRLAALCLHWYNPLVWYAVIVSKRDGELACDEATLARLGADERTAYGETLLSLVTAKPETQELLSVSTAMTAGKKTLRERIETIARHPRSKGVALLLACAVLLTATVLAFSKGTETGEPAEDPQEQQERQEQHEQQNQEPAEAPATVVMERPASVQFGNSGGNLNNGGFVASDGEQFYYVLPTEETWEIERGIIVKARVDGSIAGVLYHGNRPHYLNAIGDWVYFTARTSEYDKAQIYALRSDGSALRELLSEERFDRISHVSVADGSIYFIAETLRIPGTDGTDDHAIYRIPITGGEAERITEVDFRTQNYAIGDGWITCSSGGETFRIRTDGTDKEIIAEFPLRAVNAAGGKLYALQPTDICQMDTDGGNPIALTEGKVIVNMNVADGWIYYCADSSIFKMKTDGSEARQVCDYSREQGSFPGIIVLGDWLYLTGGEQGLCRVRTDGSGFQAVEKPQEGEYVPSYDVG